LSLLLCGCEEIGHVYDDFTPLCTGGGKLEQPIMAL
jgi:hypothetical protein